MTPPTIKNRKAYYDYFILESFISGIKLQGSEVKSLRQGKGNLQKAWVYVKNGEIFIRDLTIPNYQTRAYFEHTENRDRKLLLLKKDINKLEKESFQKGKSIVPLELFFERGWVKIKIALVQGKKKWDKREKIKEREVNRKILRKLK